MLTAIADVTRQAAAFTPTPAFTATLPAEPTATPPPTVAVTLQPVPAVANANLNVRSDPRRGGQNLGGVFFNQKISVVARNPEATWYYILWPDSPSGYAWILASAVEIPPADLYRLPIASYDKSGSLILRPAIVWEILGTPLPIPPVPQGEKIRPATVIAPANARVCPSVGCMVLTVLPPGQQINLTGRYGDNEWAQFDFPLRPGRQSMGSPQRARTRTGWLLRPAALRCAGHGTDPRTAHPHPRPQPDAHPHPHPAPHPGRAAGAHGSRCRHLRRTQLAFGAGGAPQERG